jgi:hypothetical protein
MKLRNLNIEERMEYYNMRGLSLAYIKIVKLVWSKITV